MNIGALNNPSYLLRYYNIVTTIALIIVLLFNIKKTKHFVCSYSKHLALIIIFLVSLYLKFELLSITSLLIAIVGIKRFRQFISAILSKLEKSKEGSVAGLSWKLDKAEPLPERSLVLEEQSGVSSSFYQHVSEGRQNLEKGLFKKALEQFKQANQDSPDNYQVLTSLGFLYNSVGQNDESIEYSKKALAIQPGSLVPQFNLAIATNHLYGSSKSLNEYLEAEDYSKNTGMPESVLIAKLHLFIGHDFRETGNPDEALSRYRQAIRILKKYQTSEAKYWLNDAYVNVHRLTGMEWDGLR